MDSKIMIISGTYQNQPAVFLSGEWGTAEEPIRAAREYLATHCVIKGAPEQVLAYEISGPGGPLWEMAQMGNSPDLDRLVEMRISWSNRYRDFPYYAVSIIFGEVADLAFRERYGAELRRRELEDLRNNISSVSRLWNNAYGQYQEAAVRFENEELILYLYGNAGENGMSSAWRGYGTRPPEEEVTLPEWVKGIVLRYHEVEIYLDSKVGGEEVAPGWSCLKLFTNGLVGRFKLPDLSGVKALNVDQKGLVEPSTRKA
jgi:hypothetical protein